MSVLSYDFIRRVDNTHRESVSGRVGFNLGFISTLPWSVGWFCTVDFNVYGYLWGTVIAQRFGIADVKFEFAVQDAIKTPKLKPPQPERLWQDIPRPAA